MAYQLRKEKKKDRIYLKIYYNYRDPDHKNPRSQFVKSIGYVDVLQASGMEDPISHYKTVVQEMNETINQPFQSSNVPQIGAIPPIRRLGYFPLQMIVRQLRLQSALEQMALAEGLPASIVNTLLTLVYAKAVRGDAETPWMSTLATLYPPYSGSEEEIQQCLDWAGSHNRQILDCFKECLLEAGACSDSAAAAVHSLLPVLDSPSLVSEMRLTEAAWLRTCLQEEGLPVLEDSEHQITGYTVVLALNLLLERLFQSWILKDAFDLEALEDFFQNFNFAIDSEGSFANISYRSRLLEVLAGEFSLPLLSLYPTARQLDAILRASMRDY